MSDTLTHNDLAVLAAELIDNLDDTENYAAIFLVAGLNADGDIYVQMRSSGSHSLSNIRVLQEAQLLETRLAIDEATEQ